MEIAYNAYCLFFLLWLLISVYFLNFCISFLMLPFLVNKDVYMITYAAVVARMGLMTARRASTVAALPALDYFGRELGATGVAAVVYGAAVIY